MIKAHWKKISPAGIYECSECHGNVMTSDIECYKFCHHCGADMSDTEFWSGHHGPKMTAEKGTFDKIYQEAEEEDENGL